MKVLVLLGSDAEGEVLEQSLVEDVTSFVAAGGAERGAVNVRAGGEDHDLLAMVDTEQDASALVVLWEPTSVDDALKLGTASGARLVGAYRVDEVVQKDYERVWGTGATSPGVKLVCFVRRRP